MPRRKSVPTYRRHKASGQAVVTIHGHDHYLGVHGSEGSHREYARLIAEWQAAGGVHSPPPAPAADVLTVAGLAARYLVERAEPRYREADPDTGTMKPKSMLHRVRSALRPLTELYGHTPAAEFGPRRLKVVRDALVKRDYARSHVNALVECVLRCFAWAVEEELLPEPVHRALGLVPALEAGEGRESEPVGPVPESHIPPVLDRVLPPVGAMIELQLWTGCRPGEACQLRPGDLDRAGPVWLYRPRRHKTMKKGHKRVIFIGPRAQKVLAPFLDRPAEAYCFSPREAVLAYLRARGRREVTTAGARYTTASYGRAVREACDALGVPRWRPHRLRHSAAARLVDDIGWERAKIVLGHATLKMTERYAGGATREQRDAADAMGRAG